MAYYIYIEKNQINGAGLCKILNEDILNIEISKELYDSYLVDADKYIWDGSNIIENPNYEELKREQQRKKQKCLIEEELDALDKKRIRAICENEIKDTETGETWLDFYNKQVIELRIKLNNL